MQRSPELEKRAREMIDAMQASDFPTMERALSRTDGSVLIGSDPGEYTRDIDEMLQIMRDSTPDQGYHITVTLDDLRGYQEGDVGWIDGIGRFERDGRTVAVRMTGVAHREDGEWRFVQTHASIGVPDEHMFEPLFQRTATAT
jgi:ketosteroid isomerase-like protein